MNLYLVNLKDCRYDYDDLFSSLDLDIQNRVNSHKNEDDRIRSLIGHILIKKFTSAEKLMFSEHGKPYKNHSFFNVSHSKDFVVLVTANSPVGVDIEHISREKKKLDEYVFDSKMDGLSFLENWTRLEALLKCEGIGFDNGFKDVPHNEGIVILNNKTFSLETIHLGDYILSVAIQDDQKEKITSHRIEKL